MPPGLCACTCVCACVCAEAARCWQGSDIGPVALNSLCQLSQANVDASITLYSLPSEWHSSAHFFKKFNLFICIAQPRHVHAGTWECLCFVVCVCFFFLLYLCVCFLLFSWSSCGELLHFRVTRPLPKVEQEAEACRQWTGNGRLGGGGEEGAGDKKQCINREKMKCRERVRYEANGEDKRARKHLG